MKFQILLSAAVVTVLFTLASSPVIACNAVPQTIDLPPDRLEAHKKAQAIINRDKPVKGSNEYYQELYQASRHIYVGRVKLILDKSDRADEAKKDDSLYAYVKISKGWKSGKVRDVRLRIPKDEPLCDPRLQYQLKEKLKFLFFENRKGLITALPLNKNTTADQYAAEAIEFFGQSDWYYSRNTTIHYNSKR
jgi:hypothetical protein